MVRDRFAVSIQTEPFVTEALQKALHEREAGAIVTFTGYVRACNDGAAITALELEHYPGMTENSLRAILDEAAQRWSVLAATVVHRVGLLAVGEPVVWVGVSSAHRGDAFTACEYVMDYLKTEAPFWKKEHGDTGSRWLEARASDSERARRWQLP
ncbi:molybdopterin synthase catalytic subunit [Kineobactrum sediminis]|uniref:Molybdopterin synthase catalytic subunit n=1 Tax=Kineobactrum sediminis TaxID=1905677 RepID=A0A2N5Y363_9GAMM|nr:molybdenum cofactor biosynthesis protein MoaE [Kineobactrum sediminis]PLW82842.1 molybdopterin synthase catalytic subunit [Kineobactrum sediminis]